MPSFRSIFLVATTAFAALTSAAPLAGGVEQGTQVVGLNNVANNIAQGVSVSDIHVTGIQARDPPAAIPGAVQPVLDALQNAANGLPTKSKRDTQSLPEILTGAQEQLHTLTATLDALTDGKTTVDTGDLKAIIAGVQVIVAGVLVNVKALIGLSPSTILALNGQVLAAVDVAQILVAVLALIYNILAIVVRVTSDIAVVGPLVSTVATLLAQLLAVIFTQLNVGIFAAITPLLTPALSNAWAALNLTVVVNVLKTGKL